jgi:hypothetical protein
VYIDGAIASFLMLARFDLRGPDSLRLLGCVGVGIGLVKSLGCNHGLAPKAVIALDA